MSVRPVRLPDRFYLPRPTPDGGEVRDVMPWEGAVSYASDGERLGIQFADGRVVWLGSAQAAGSAPVDGEDGENGDDPAMALKEFADDFAGVNMEALVEGLRSYMDLHPVLKTVWREDLQALDQLRARGAPPHEGELS